MRALFGAEGRKGVHVSRAARGNPDRVEHAASVFTETTSASIRITIIEVEGISLVRIVRCFEAKVCVRSLFPPSILVRTRMEGIDVVRAGILQELWKKSVELCFRSEERASCITGSAAVRVEHRVQARKISGPFDSGVGSSGSKLSCEGTLSRRDVNAVCVEIGLAHFIHEN